ncbi:MAG: transcriptional repressor [Firmicutes bacterium]|nr:transcriptional repressor [Bacillota bacterium]
MNLTTSRVQRRTRQREVILEELRKVKTHPTADEVYEMVRQKLPRISLGTVYRNLELMAEEGLIQKLELAGTQKRFDGNPANHYHVRCMRCGRVEDVPVDPDTIVDKALRAASDYEIIGYRLKLIGLCPQCAREEPDYYKGSPKDGQKGERS